MTRVLQNPRAGLLAAAVALTLAIADPAGAALKRYDIRWTAISQFNTQNPPVLKRSFFELTGSRAIINETQNDHPALKRLLLIQDHSGTVSILTIPPKYIYLSYHYEQGPASHLEFAGTGSTNTSIAWGAVTGWTITGGLYCHATPFSSYCIYALASDLATVEPVLNSPFYDLGTWTFHGTGFTAAPFVHQVAAPSSGSFGNAQFQLKGRLAAGLVPAVPVLGVVLLGASLVVAGARLVRSRR